MIKTKAKTSMLFIKQVLDIERLMQQPKAMMHSLWIRFEDRVDIDILVKRAEKKEIKITKATESLLKKFHKAGYAQTADGVLSVFGASMIKAQHDLLMFSFKNWHNRFEWHSIKPYGLKDLETNVTCIQRPNLKHAALESGYWTNGHMIMKLPPTEFDHLRIAWRTHFEADAHYPDLQHHLDTRGKKLHVAHLEAICTVARDPNFDAYLIRANEGDEYAVVNAAYYETIKLRYPDTRVFVENRNSAIRFFDKLKPVGFVMQIVRVGEEGPVVDINGMLED